MVKLKNFLKTTVLGGVTVILPVVLTVLFLRWLINLVIGMIHPLTQVIFKDTAVQKYLAYLIVFALVILLFFLVGLIVRTRLGKFLLRILEQRILKIAPGYSLFREAIRQFLGQEKRPFSRVALVQIFENSTLATAFITDEHPDGRYTVFVPSGLNPTSGQIFHLEPRYVHLVDVSVEDTMRSIISCGAGSGQILKKLKKEQQAKIGEYKRMEADTCPKK